MLNVDRRVGSGDLEVPLRRMGLDVELVTMDFGDVSFLGHGELGMDSMQIGIEIKNIRDLLSSIQSGRLSGHQLPGLLRTYDAAWLIVEGEWRPAADGLLELKRGREWGPLELGQRRYLYREVDNYLTTLECKCGMRIRRTWSRDETARVIADLYGWWRDKDWAEHRSHLALHRPADTAMLIPPPLRRRLAIELPGVGHQKSADVARHFPNSMAMLLADVKEWAQVKGIGKTMATRIVDALWRE